MSNTIEQTYWDKNFSQDPEFANKFFTAIGDKTAHSKKWFRLWLKNHPEFKNCLDVGCGPATEFEAFREDEISVAYTGVDSSNHLVEMNKSRGVDMINAHAHSIPVNDSSYDLVMSRHVLEHNPTFQPVLEEMIRCASKLAVHIFFIKPKAHEKINFDENQGLYPGNTYNFNDINVFLENHPKVDRYEWVDINKKENMILAWIK